jgi:hypothetical protein
MWWVKRLEGIIIVKVKDIWAYDLEEAIINNLIRIRFKVHPHVMRKIKNTKKIILKTVVKLTKII